MSDDAEFTGDERGNLARVWRILYPITQRII